MFFQKSFKNCLNQSIKLMFNIMFNNVTSMRYFKFKKKKYFVYGIKRYNLY